MTANLPELLSRLAGKCDILAERYALVKKQRDEALARCEELQALADSLTSQLQQANTEIEYLRISHKIAPTEEAAREARDMLTAMVKKIDKCITRLRND